MKLSRIPGGEPTVKHSFALKKSTTEALGRYQSRYMTVHGVEVALKDMVELMLVTFMAEDKAFQKADKPAATTVSPAVSAPSAQEPAGAAQY